jgi:hypothetical protein
MDGGTIEKLSRDFGAAGADLSELRVLPFDGAKEGKNCYAGATQDEEADGRGSATHRHHCLRP